VAKQRAAGQRGDINANDYMLAARDHAAVLSALYQSGHYAICLLYTSDAADE